MSDAVCGPSNPLQQFKQQTQLDRSLQQDRIANRQHPAQGFRSADPNAGLLDPEFEAFQAGLPAPDLPQFQNYHHAPPAFQQPFQEPAQGPSWASDFQRMNISSPPPMQQQHHAAGPSTANWAQGFRESIAQNAPRAQNSSPSPFAFQQRARFGMNGYQSNFAQPAFNPATQAKGKEPATEQFDEAAFERAFDMAKEDMMVEDVSMGNAESLEQDIANSLHGQREAQDVSQSDVREMNGMLANNEDPGDMAFGQELLDPNFWEEAAAKRKLQESFGQEQQDSQQNSREDDDALAATAHELLEKVEHNKTDKFRNSQFLGLMRRLRDREMKVEGDKMVETVSATHPARVLTPDSGYGSSTDTTLPSTHPSRPARARPNPSVCKVIPRESTTSTSTSTTDLPLNTHASTPLRFDNTEQTPAPLDSRPLDYGMPAAEQDHDPHRDGADVVHLLSQQGQPAGPLNPPVGADEGPRDDIGTSPSSPPCPSAPSPAQGPFYADLRPEHEHNVYRSPHEMGAYSQNESLSYMLYGPDGALSV